MLWSSSKKKAGGKEDSCGLSVLKPLNFYPEFCGCFVRKKKEYRKFATYEQKGIATRAVLFCIEKRRCDKYTPSFLCLQILSGIFVCAKATRANVFVRLFAVDFDSYFMNVGTERTLCVAIGMTYVVAAYFAFSANDAYSAHGF